MTIRANIEKRMEEMQKEVEKLGTQGGEVSKNVKEAAIAAILGGAAEWVTYMNLFATTPAELARLIPGVEPDDNSDRLEARAYLVANAVCAPATATGLLESVFDRLDTPPV